MLAAGVLLASSCQTEQQLEDTTVGGEGVVQFAIDLEEDMASRTVGDASLVNTLQYSVFDTKGIKVAGGKVAVNNKKATVNVTLAKDQTYNATFWAQNDECDDYLVTSGDGGMNVTVVYENIQNNDPAADAFFAFKNGVTVSGQAVDVTLKRPFAQVNVGVNPANWQAAINSNFTVNKSSAIIKDVPTTLNLLTGDVVYVEDVVVNAEFESALILPSTEPLVVNNNSYNYLSLSYVLATPNTTLHEMSFTFEDKNTGKTLVFDEGLQTVPIQRNWRTNIIGDILAGNLQFEVVIDPTFDNETLMEWIDELNEGGTVTLTHDAILDQNHVISIPQGVEATLIIPDGLQLTIPATDQIDLIQNRGTLNLQGEGTIVALNDVNSRRCVYNYGEMNIDGITFIQQYATRGAALNNEGTMTITNATVEAKAYGVWNAGPDAELIINGGTFTNNATLSEYGGLPGADYCIYNGNGANMIINGGTFTGNHGVIACETEATATLNGGTFDCKATLTVTSDWVFYTPSATSTEIIKYNSTDCVIKTQNPNGFKYGNVVTL